MKKSSLISCMKYQSSKLMQMILVITGGALFFFLMALYISTKLLEPNDSEYIFEIGGADALLLFSVMAYGFSAVSDFFNVSAANGASRKTAMISFIITSTAAVIVSSLLYMTIIPAFLSVVNWEPRWAMEYMYGSIWDMQLHNGSSAAFTVQIALVTIAACLTLYFIGACIASAVYKFGTRAAITIGIIFLIMLIIVPMLAISENLSGILEQISETADIIFNNLMATAKSKDALFGNPVQGTLVCVAVSAILNAVMWLFVRRSPAMPIAVRNR